MNGVNQSVYSWYPSTNLTTLSNVDVSPLIHYLWRHNNISEDIYLGLVQWGSEAVHSQKGSNVTFDARSIMIDVVKGRPKKAGASALRLGLGSLVLVTGAVLCGLL